MRVARGELLGAQLECVRGGELTGLGYGSDVERGEESLVSPRLA